MSDTPSIQDDVKMLREALQDTELVLSESVAWAGIWACSPDRIKRLLDALEEMAVEKLYAQRNRREAESRLARAVELLRRTGGEATNATAREIDAFLKEISGE